MLHVSPSIRHNYTLEERAGQGGEWHVSRQSRNVPHTGKVETALTAYRRQMIMS